MRTPGSLAELERANAAIKFTVAFSAAAAIVSAAAPYLSTVVGFDVHLFMPWLFPGRLALPLLAALALLTFGLLRRSRVCAVLLLVLYALGKALTLMWLHDRSAAFIAVWGLLALVWVFGLRPGVVGAFSYHRSARSPEAVSRG